MKAANHMKYPTPDDFGMMPIWRNYLVAQLSAASMTLLSPRIVLVGFKENGTQVTLHFLVDAPLAEEYTEIDEIVDDFNDKTGWILQVSVEIDEWVPSKVDRSVDWTYQRFIDDGEYGPAPLQ